jgi:hypothetical protein
MTVLQTCRRLGHFRLIVADHRTTPSLRQPSARSLKGRIYESLFLLNEGADHLLPFLRDLEKLPLAEKESLQCAVVEIEEVRCDVNADFTEKLADSKRFDEGCFWKQ